MKDEIKEINIPENVLVALGDLTNGALNYYKATETVKVKYNTILDYITNLQEEKDDAIQCLKYYEETHFIKPTINNTKLTMELANAYMGDINNLQQENKKLQEENKRLKELDENYPIEEQLEEALKYENIYKSRNEKAIEKLESIRSFGLRSGKTLFSTLIDESIDILQGEDKDVKNKNN